MKCPYPIKGIAFKTGQSFQSTLTQFSAVGAHLPKCKVKKEQLISEGMWALREYEFIRCLFLKVKSIHSPKDASIACCPLLPGCAAC